MQVFWPDGHSEWFVVGVDSHAWHMTVNYSRWQPMGGTMTDMRSAYINYVGEPEISVYTAHTNIWCAAWTIRWDWYDCPG
jgi:hypothetical protein